MSSSETKFCPHCDEEIRAAAKKCRHCGEMVDDDGDDFDEPAPRRRKKHVPGTAERMLIPVGRPISAIAAGYCALFGVVPLFGLPFSIAAMVCGVFALIAIRKNPDLSGKGRAWFGIILGFLATAFSLFGVTVLVLAAAKKLPPGF